jgi:hypothetical protein
MVDRVKIALSLEITLPSRCVQHHLVQYVHSPIVWNQADLSLSIRNYRVLGRRIQIYPVLQQVQSTMPGERQEEIPEKEEEVVLLTRHHLLIM